MEEKFLNEEEFKKEEVRILETIKKTLGKFRAGRSAEEIGESLLKEEYKARSRLRYITAILSLLFDDLTYPKKSFDSLLEDTMNLIHLLLEGGK